MEEKGRYIYLVTSYQVVYTSGNRDTVKLAQAEFTDDKESYRMSLVKKHGCMNINLTYTEIDKDKINL